MSALILILFIISIFVNVFLTVSCFSLKKQVDFLHSEVFKILSDLDSIDDNINNLYTFVPDPESQEGDTL